ncbi:MAG: hypothetical protein WC289_03765, partial [Patescibacteria group bacterium]
MSMKVSLRNKIIAGIILVFVVAGIAALLMFYFEKYAAPEQAGRGEAIEEGQEAKEPPVPLDTVVNLLFRAMIETGMSEVSIDDEDFVWKARRRADGDQSEVIDIPIVGKSITENNILPASHRPINIFFGNEGFLAAVGNVPGESELYVDAYQKDDIVCLVSEFMRTSEFQGEAGVVNNYSIQTQNIKIKCGKIQPKDMR